MKAICKAAKSQNIVSFQRDSFDQELEKEQTSIREEKRLVGVQPTRLEFVVNNHGEDATLPWRQQQQQLLQPQQQQQQNVPLDNVATPLVVSELLIQDIEETVPETAPLTDREKRCLAVPIGDLHDDKKRKLLRTRSTPNRPL